MLNDDVLKILEMMNEQQKNLQKQMNEEMNILFDLLNREAPIKIEGKVSLDEKVNVQKADIGIICHSNKQQQMPSLLEIFGELSEEYNVRIVLFTMDQLNLNLNRIENGILIVNHMHWEDIVEIPHYIYNFVLHSKPSSVAKMRDLRVQSKITVVNPINRFHQDVLFEMLNAVSDFKDVLLPISKITSSSIKKFSKISNLFYLLPERTQVNERAVRIERLMDGCFSITYGEIQFTVKANDLFYEIKKMVRKRAYLIVEDLEYLKWGKSPLEARVYVQKDGRGSWKTQHMLAKKQIFSTHSIFDKVSDDLFSILVDIRSDITETTISKLSTNAVDVCVILDYFMSNLGSVYMDYVIGGDGSPYILRIGGVEQNNFLFESSKHWKEYVKNAGAYLISRMNKEK